MKRKKLSQSRPHLSDTELRSVSLNGRSSTPQIWSDGGALRRYRALHVSVFLLIANIILLALSQSTPSRAEEPSSEIVLREALVVGSMGRYGRSAVHTDAIEAQIVAGTWSAPKAGDTVALPDGTSRTWESVTADEDGWFNNPALRGGYAYMSVDADAERVMLLEAAGHSTVYVNGTPRAGDPYQYGYVRLPVLLKKGKNDLLFHVTRGRLRAKLNAPKSGIILHVGDTTLPDLIVGEPVQTWGAVVVINATTTPLHNVTLSASMGKSKPTLTSVPSVPPLSTRKVGFSLKGQVPAEAGTHEVKLELMQKGGERLRRLDTTTLTLRVRHPHQTYKRTFLSHIDGSVQYYAVNPAQPIVSPNSSHQGREGDEGKPASRRPDKSGRRGIATPPPSWGRLGGGAPPALFLSLHGAGVEAIGQADAYSYKTWGHLVAPTNRRPFGFDWEDWGRLDALEVLDLAQKELGTDPQRTYLTGHSMGGHGVWHLGVTFPDRFAAIGPSAGWISFWSYAGGTRFDGDDPIEEMLRRATAPSDTVSLVRNYAQHGVYVLHGSADDNVPVTQARTMKEHLGGFHRDFVYHEQSGAGHWWDASDEPGTDCVDWAPMFDFFVRRIRPRDESVRTVEFTTASPGVSAWSHWVGIEAQIRQHVPSHVSVRYDPGRRRFAGTTDNVARIVFSINHVRPGGTVTVELDGQKVEDIPIPAEMPRLYLTREGEKWSVTPPPSPSLKGPHRCGPFKDAFRHRVIFVYGTRGAAEENAWAFAKARYDAETFWYRGNASVDVVPDVAFDASRDRDRSVILYGNAQTNTVWDALLKDSPVQVRRGAVRIGEREVRGDDLACLFVRPRPGSDKASVGVVSGSGIVGMRLTDRLPYFVSGVGYPDCIVIGPEMLSQGSAGVRAAGYFGLDWSVTTGEFAWRE